jgi:hypothetical protein
LGVIFIAVFWAKDEWGGRFFGTIIGSAFVLLSIRLLFNAFRKSKTLREDENNREE